MRTLYLDFIPHTFYLKMFLLFCLGKKQCMLYCVNNNDDKAHRMRYAVDDGTLCNTISNDVCIKGVCTVSINLILLMSTPMHIKGRMVFPLFFLCFYNIKHNFWLSKARKKSIL